MRLRRSRPAERRAPFSFFPQLAANSRSMKPSICWRNFSPVSEPPDFRHAGKQVGVHVLHLHHLCQAHLAVGAADAAELEPAVRRLGDAKARDHVVNHHRAGLDPLCHALAATTICRPHTGSQAEVAVVGQANGLVVGVEGRDGKDRAEGLLLDDAHVLRHVGEQRRRVEVRPEFGQALSALQQARAMQHGVSHMLVHHAQLALVNERPNFNFRANSVADAQLGDFGAAGFEELFVQAAMDVTALDRKARLAGIHERAPQRAAGGDRPGRHRRARSWDLCRPTPAPPATAFAPRLQQRACRWQRCR